MKDEEIIEKAYDLFSSFKRPLLFTRVDKNDDDPEADNHDDWLKNTGLINFSDMAARFGHTGIQEPETRSQNKEDSICFILHTGINCVFTKMNPKGIPYYSPGLRR